MCLTEEDDLMTPDDDGVFRMIDWLWERFVNRHDGVENWTVNWKSPLGCASFPAIVIPNRTRRWFHDWKPGVDLTDFFPAPTYSLFSTIPPPPESLTAYIDAAREYLQRTCGIPSAVFSRQDAADSTAQAALLSRRWARR